jgi:hypothetical protein
VPPRQITLMLAVPLLKPIAKPFFHNWSQKYYIKEYSDLKRSKFKKSFQLLIIVVYLQPVYKL